MFSIFRRLQPISRDQQLLMNVGRWNAQVKLGAIAPAKKGKAIVKPVDVPATSPCISVEFPIFGSNARKIPLTSQQEKFYRKYAPNYITVIVQKAISDQLKNKMETHERFSKFGTYCQVTYNKDQMHCKGLHKVIIENLRKLDVSEDAEVPQGTLPIPVVEHIEEQTQESEETNRVLEMFLKIENKNKSAERATKDFFLAKLSKFIEPPYKMNVDLELKSKNLTSSYVQFYGGDKKQMLLNINNITTLVDAIASDICQRQYVPAIPFQQLFQSQDLSEKMTMLQKMLDYSWFFSNNLKDLEKTFHHNINKKRFQEYFGEVARLSKYIAQGAQSKQLFIQECQKRFYKNNPSEDIRKAFAVQVEKLSNADENHLDGALSKVYIEELSKVPYNVLSKDNYDIQQAHKALDSEHYGMQEAKDSILELLAVGNLQGNLKGKILCLIGAPGLGKTTLASSIAKALGRKFVNISLGGTNDSSVLKGHRRTYVGAYPGKIIRALATCGVSNPVILLDEIDKMGKSHHGDPSSELLEILDPALNHNFVDNYLDVSVDLSNVLFICSANYIERISKPLLDRMYKIHLTSYTNHEKRKIFDKHILRKTLADTGVDPEKYNITPEAVNMLIEEYTHGEPGVRDLQKNTKKIIEKIAYKIVQGEKTPIMVTPENLPTFLGSPPYIRKDHTRIGPGVAIGIGDAPYGGRLNKIQAIRRTHAEGESGYLVTGSLGQVLKQAVQISYTFARNLLLQRFNNKYLFQNKIHIHAPAGASKKDGPNDSIAIVSALISLATGKEIKKNLAMTGQVSLKGRIMKVPNCKQKVLVAKRQKIKELVLPQSNRYEVEELPEEIKEGLQFHFVNSYDEVLRLIDI